MRWDGWIQQGRTNLVTAALCAAALAAGCGDDTDGSAGASSDGDVGADGAGCLDARSHDALFSLVDPAWCAVAVHQTDEDIGFASVTWGRHGGPMFVRSGAGGAAEIVRLTPPDGAASGELTAARAEIDAGVPDDAFLGVQAVDLPFFDWTAISWTSAFPDTLGELILIEDRAVAQRYEVNGFFAAAGVEGRLLHTGLSPLGDPAAGSSGLYAAESCGAAGQDARLVPEGDAGCAEPAAVATWGDNSGPVAADRRGNVFAVLPSADGSQQARGFASGAIARGAEPTDGDALFTLPGGGMGLAALAPEQGAPGVVVFQPTDPATYEALAPVVVAFRDDGGRIQADGSPAPLLDLATAGTSLSLVADEANRLWIGGPLPGGRFLFTVVVRR